MAIDLTSKDIVAFGDRANRKQMIFLIPAEASADKPGILVLGNVDGSGTVGNGACIWADNTGAIRYGTTIPTDEDSDGTAISASAGANVTLSNITTAAINTTLASDTANTDDLGTEPKPWRTGYLGTSLVFVGTTYNSTIAFTEGAASRTYTIPDAGAAAKVMLDTGATNGITYTNGTSSIALAAGNTDISLAAGANITVGAAGDVDFGTGAVAFNGTAAFDQATGTTVDINANLTVSGAATIDQDLSASGAPTWTSLVTCQGIVNTTTAIDTTAAIQIGADNVKLSFGASDSTDSWIHFDGAGNMMLYDSNLGTARSLTEMFTGTTLNPAVVGNLSIADGNFTWTNAATDETAVFTLAATTVDGIQIASSNTTADVLQITANATNSGNLISLNATDATITSGAYIYCYDGAAQDFAVRRYGATTIAGNAATTVLTVTAGHILASAGNITATLGDIVATAGNVNLTLGNVALTDGDITNAEGKITIDSTSDEISYIKRNNATGTGPVFEVEETNAAGGVTLLVDSDHTGASDAAQITYDGTASGLNITNTAVTGTQLTLAGPAAQTTAVLYYTGDFDGATDVGVIDITSTGTHVHANTSLLYLDHNTGAPAASARGSLLRLNDTTANAADAWVAYIGTTNNDGLLITTGAVADINLKLTGIQAQTSSMVVIDGSTGTGWDGADDTGCLHINTLIQQHTGATALFVDSAAAPIASAQGACARFIQSAGAATTDGYLVEIAAITTGGALNVASGFSTFAEKATFTSGLVTKVATTDVTDPPTQAEMVTAFGAAATAGAGFIGMIDDAGGGSNEFLCISDGTNWFYLAKATVGA